MKRALLSLAGLLFIASCLDVAQQRAERDLTIGQAENEAAKLIVAEGLAHVRSFVGADISLWGSAPTFSMTLQSKHSTPTRFHLRVENTLSDATLAASTESGESVPVVLVEKPFPTEHVWSVEVPAQSTLKLSIHAPDEADISPFRFAIYADVQEALPRVQDIYRKMNEMPDIRFALISGDLTSRGTPEELETFQREMKTLAFPCFSTLGNHELGTRDDLYQSYFGRANSSFEFRGMRFTLLDSASATLDPLAREMLDDWLLRGRDKPHVVTMHLPLLDPVGTRNGAFANRAEADDVLTALVRGNVDLTVYGHIHSYYAFANASIPAYITGGGGAIPERLDGIGRHFLKVDAHPPSAIESVSLVRVD